MAAVAKGKVRSASPTGYEVNDKGQAKVAIAVGDLLVITSDAAPRGFEQVFDKAPITGITEAHAIALTAADIGQLVNVAIQGEVDGFTGLTPGSPLYPSTATAGGIDTTAIASATVRIRAITPTRLRVSFV